MSYTTNKNMPRIRKEAAQLLVRKNWSTRKVARHFGFSKMGINLKTLMRLIQK